jgi:CheY-like chemotaxis protein
MPAIGKIALKESKRVLLYVTDKARMDEGLWRWLSQNGTVILHARSTAGALELFKWGRIDAVVTNLHRIEDRAKNPEAGLELTREIRRINAWIPVLIYTAGIRASTKMICAQAGATMTTTLPQELRVGLKKALQL